ncbi:MAG TPA: hypothetical protein PK820_03070, partial [Candidatus Competibacteraceae bacterium]|nr:hypothetical protein [Candidatus Competibacteraceae bacterium]
RLRQALGIKMKVRLQPPNARDEFYLVDFALFMKHVDTWDLEQRESIDIRDAFHKHWFAEGADGIWLFHVPEFYLQNGVAKFINGRHRALLLGRYLAEIPMALTNMDGYPIMALSPHPSSRTVLQQISIKKLVGDEIFELPDLPIRYMGFDPNIGK